MAVKKKAKVALQTCWAVTRWGRVVVREDELLTYTTKKRAREMLRPFETANRVSITIHPDARKKGRKS